MVQNWVYASISLCCHQIVGFYVMTGLAMGLSMYQLLNLLKGWVKINTQENMEEAFPDGLLFSLRIDETVVFRSTIVLQLVHQDP